MAGLGRTLFLCALALAGYYTLFGGEYTLFEQRAASSSLVAESARLACLEQVTDSLEARVAALQNDDATLEEIARSEWGMIRDGEILYRFPDQTGSSLSDVPEVRDPAARCGEPGAEERSPDESAAGESDAVSSAPD